MCTVKIEGLDHVLHKAEDADNSALYDDAMQRACGNTPGNIAQGGAFCDTMNHAFLPFKGAYYHYDKTKKCIETLFPSMGSQNHCLKGICYVDGEFYYEPTCDNDMVMDRLLQIEAVSYSCGISISNSQLLHENTLYYANQNDGNRIYAWKLHRSKLGTMLDSPPIELAPNCPSYEFQELHMMIMDNRLYYTADGQSTINYIDLSSDRYNTTNYHVEWLSEKSIVASTRGLYYISDEGCLCLISKDIQSNSVIVDDVVFDFNLHKYRIVYRTPVGIFVCEPDGSRKELIIPTDDEFYMPYLYVIEDTIYFELQLLQNGTSDLYRIQVDGTDLVWIREPEMLIHKPK